MDWRSLQTQSFPSTDYDVTATDFETSAWLVYPSRTYIPLKVNVFIEFLKERLESVKSIK